MKEYIFSYFTVKNTVRIDEYALRIKTGPFIKKEMSLNNLQHFYLFDNKDYNSVYLLYTDEKGKPKKVQLIATPAELGFIDLVKELQYRFPEKSLNHLSEAEAFKAMKTANPKKWAPIVAFLIIAVVMAGLFYPGLRHYFDFGFGKTTATELANGTYSGSRNISISGILLHQTLEETTKRRKSNITDVSVFVPMVDESWKEGDPVKVVLQFDELSTMESTQIYYDKTHLGVIRNIAWEGLEKSQIGFFKDEFGLTVHKDAVLVEITNETHNDEWALYALILVLVILGVLFIIVAVKRRSK
ncbi:MAG: hypothetical protein M3R17_06830 [Bacteroidota bacterium]|nr:hypothetical protein [Bacteroidota bacterium]